MHVKLPDIQSLLAIHTLNMLEGREGGEKKRAQRARGPGARTRDLPRARRGSPAARQGGCLDKQAFPCL